MMKPEFRLLRTGRSLFCMAILFSTALYAADFEESSDENSDALLRVSMLLDAGLEKNQSFILRESGKLSLTDRQTLFDTRRKENAITYSTVNFIVGLGIGSFIQGNTASGLGFLVADIAAVSSMTTSSGDMAYLGLGVFAFSRVLSFVTPFFYQKNYNATLKKSLALEPDVSFIPIIRSNDGAGLQMAINF